jgi:Na+-transporting NADH:ubiquinone oxidoreductase subunit C
MKNIKIIVFVLIMGLISGGFLVIVNNWTKEKIRKNMEFKIKSAILDSFSIEYSKDNIENVFSKNVEEVKMDTLSYYKTKNGEIGLIFSGSGLWGPINGVISLESDKKTIRRIVIIHQEETPGLGGRIAEEEFLNNFKGKIILPEIRMVPPGKAEKENEVDSITGATGTSKAFEKILNQTINKYMKILGG